MTPRTRVAVALGVSLASVALVWLAFAASVLAQSPTASSAGGDPRSPGEGPGLVGDPGFAIAGVVIIAVLAVAGTLAYVRLTAGREDGRDRR